MTIWFLAIRPSGVISAAATLPYRLSGSELSGSPLGRVAIEHGWIVVLDTGPSGYALLDDG